MPRTFSSRVVLALALVLTAPSVAAQEVVQPIPGTTDADRLGDQMRRVGADPRNVDALLTAGELSLKLGDLSGAASLFARAEKVDPRSGRLKAGMAAILVRSERPGEALRYFAQAQALGYDQRRFAADRGLAYDLIGEQARAQADYRVALKDVPDDDETVRRYALSLGISGRQKPALDALDPLLRKADRASWRARAFVLAMTGNAAEASTIARTMMPPGMATGLQPFFERLPTLPAIDRAFAVHFGEVRPTPERIADARLVPALPTFVPDIVAAPVVLATVQQRVETGRERRERERRERRDAKARTQVAAVEARAAARRPSVQVAAAAARPVQVASASILPQRPPGVAAVPQATIAPQPAIVAQTASASRVTVPAPIASAPVAPTPTTQPVVVAQAQGRPVVVPATPVAQVPVATTSPSTTAPVILAATAPTPTPVVATASSPSVPESRPTATSMVAATVSTTGSAPAPVAIAATPPVSVGRRGDDSILARIVAGLSIPASELGVVEPERATRSTAVAGSAERVVAVADAKEARDAAVRALVDGRIPRDARGRRLRTAVATADVEPDAALTPAQRRAAARKLAATAAIDAKAGDADAPLTPAERRAAARKLATTAAIEAKAAKADEPLTPAEQRAATRKAAVDKKAAVAKKAAADAKLLADKEVAAEKKLARTNPARIWVQVAGGATEAGLPSAWATMKRRAPTAFGSRQGWTTPLRATNRVLAGPFKTDAEARTFVNQLAKEGVPAFTFTSEAGQAVTKLPAK